jgi:hypothetical protein
VGRASLVVKAAAVLDVGALAAAALAAAFDIASLDEDDEADVDAWPTGPIALLAQPPSGSASTNGAPARQPFRFMTPPGSVVVRRYL